MSTLNPGLATPILAPKPNKHRPSIGVLVHRPLSCGDLHVHSGIVELHSRWERGIAPTKDRVHHEGLLQCRQQLGSVQNLSVEPDHWNGAAHVELIKWG